MQELEKRIGLLRILLADIEGKQERVAEMEGQYRAQLAKVVEFVVYREGDVGNALNVMSEIQAKLDEVTQTWSHLEMIAGRVNTELEVLLLTKRVAEARSQLAELEERQQALTARLTHQLSGADLEEGLIMEGELAQVEDIRAIYDEIEREIARLHELITDASERAAHTIQPKTKERVQ